MTIIKPHILSCESPREKERGEEIFEDVMVMNFQKLTKRRKCMDNKNHEENILKSNLRQATYKRTNRMTTVFPTATMKTGR